MTSMQPPNRPTVICDRSALEVTVDRFNEQREELLKNHLGKWVCFAPNGLVFGPSNDAAGAYSFIERRLNGGEIRFNPKNFLMLQLSADLPSSAVDLDGCCSSYQWRASLEDRDA